MPLLALVAVEGALRAFGFEHPLDPPPYEFLAPDRRLASDDGPTITDPDLFWRLRPGAHTPDGSMSVAASGFRTAFVEQKAPNVRRILCLGDSSTFGLHVSESQAWPARLETALSPDVEVLNLGVPGYTSHQGRSLLARVGEALTPDDVVIAFGAFNDWIPARGRIDAEQQPPPLWRQVRIVQLGARILGTAVPTNASNSGAETLSVLGEIRTADFEGRRRVPLEHFERDLRALLERSAALGARAVVVSQPLPCKTAARNPVARAYAAAARRMAAASQARYVDGWRIFDESGLPESALFVDFCHPSHAGHALLAAEIATALTREPATRMTAVSGR